MRVYKSGRLAQCWHVGGVNHDCFLRFDLGGTPRLDDVLRAPVSEGRAVVAAPVATL